MSQYHTQSNLIIIIVGHQIGVPMGNAKTYWSLDPEIVTRIGFEGVRSNLNFPSPFY